MAMKIPGPPMPQAGTLLTNASIVDPRWSISPKADTGPTWRKWLNMPEVELWQAVALSCNIQPPAYYPEGLNDNFDERMEISLANLVPTGMLKHVAVNRRRHTSKVTLADIADLAKSCQWPVPAEFPKAEASAIPAPIAPAEPQAAPVVAVGASVTHSTKARRDTLTPVIELAQSKCRNLKDTAEVWAALLVLAENKHPPLIGATEEGLQYYKGGVAEIFKRKSLGQRLKR